MINKIEKMDIFINTYTLEELKRFSHEILFYVIEELENTHNIIVQETLLILNSAELYSHLESHQKMILNYCEIKDIKFLENYLFWSIRVYYYKKIDLEFLKFQYETWKNAHKIYLSTVRYKEIEKLYNWILDNFDSFKKEALKSLNISDDKIVDTLCTYALESKLKEAILLCEQYCEDLNKFNNFFSTKISKTMHKIGYLWETGKINVAKEHLATALIEKLSLHFFNKFKKEKKSKDIVVLLTTSPKEYHELGINVISNTMKKMGYKAINLGANNSKKAIVLAIETFKADYLALSVTLPANIYLVKELIEEIRNIPQYETLKIIIGGFALNEIKNPSLVLGADFYSKDINEILEYIKSTSK